MNARVVDQITQTTGPAIDLGQGGGDAVFIGNIAGQIDQALLYSVGQIALFQDEAFAR